MGLQVIMAFVDNWVEGVDLYTAWAGATNHVDFFTNPAVKQLYKDNVKALTSRINTINGRKYGEDPTIFAWDLINEPRCDTACPPGTIAVSPCWVMCSTTQLSLHVVQSSCNCAVQPLVYKFVMLCVVILERHRHHLYPLSIAITAGLDM